MVIKKLPDGSFFDRALRCGAFVQFKRNLRRVR